MTSKITFQYFSDIHLEFFDDPHKIDLLNIKPCAPYLIIAGDVDNICHQVQHKYERFLNHISPLFKYIFIISGNHEYYRTIGKKQHIDKWLKYIDDNIRTITKKFDNVIYLQNETFDIPDTDITIFGTTLWSEISRDEKREVRGVLSDYTYIPNFGINKPTELFNTSITSLTNALETKKDRKFVVISHHLPSYDLIHPKYKYSGYNSAFASDVKFVNDEHIVAWVAGHTHCPMESGKFHVNPIGYPRENMFVNYNKTFTV
jgi:predicted MPP superfamily phosphohydrolase